ncbi:MAG: hypothetical protein FP812_06645 [Desulfobacula sp.]|nr:hypothetical protein [Desulfobacula sp.]
MVGKLLVWSPSEDHRHPCPALTHAAPGRCSPITDHCHCNPGGRGNHCRHCTNAGFSLVGK